MTLSNGNILRVTDLLCGGFICHRWIPRTKASDAELWWFLWSAPEPTVEQTMETPVFWDTVALIMTSLQYVEWIWWEQSYSRMSIFEVMLTFEMLTVRRQQHSFSTHGRVFLRKCQSFWDRKCLDLRGTRPPNFGFMPNALNYWAIRARHLLSHVFEHWLWWYRYF